MSGYKSKPRWTPTQEHFLVENWDKLTDEQISAALGRSLKSIRRKRQRMELKKKSGRGICEAANIPTNSGV